jgi:DNA-binding beta-propeller fold protein YncE
MKWAGKAFLVGFTAIASHFFLSSLARADTIYASDYGSDAIVRFDSNGNASPFADANSGLYRPAGLALGGSGNLYVANSGSNTVMKFDSTGNGSVFASSGLNGPSSLAFDGSGNLYVLNGSDGTIEKFDSSGHGTFFASVGLTLSQGLACDASGNLYVANVPILAPGSLIRVNKFDSSGNQSVFASFLFPANEMIPGGLAFDTSGNLYVAIDYLFRPSPEFIYRIDPSGSQSLFTSSGLASPRGLAFGSGGDLYVANVNGTIEKFDSSANASPFASGLNQLRGIAGQAVPEPATWFLLALGILALLGSRQFCRRVS